MRIGFCVFPYVTQLDFTGPLQVLHNVPNSEVVVAAESLSPVPTDCGFSVLPTTTFADCPPLDVLICPGGAGVYQAVQNEGLIDFVHRTTEAVSYIGSVCTGAFILGVAGLLRGKMATTHWAYTDLLPLVGAHFQSGRVVRDGNTFTGGGVTAGIDFGLTIASEIAGQSVAEQIQLAIEYDPHPPFSVGHPRVASADTTANTKVQFQPRVERMQKLLEIKSKELS